MSASGVAARTGESGRADDLRTASPEPVYEREQAEAVRERQRGLGLVHQVEARLVEHLVEHVQEALAMTHRRDIFAPVAGQLALRDRLHEAEGGLGPEEVTLLLEPGPLLHAQSELGEIELQQLAESGPRPVVDVLASGPPTSGIQSVRLGDGLDDGGLAGAVLADQEGAPRAWNRDAGLSRSGDGTVVAPPQSCRGNRAEPPLPTARDGGHRRDAERSASVDSMAIRSPRGRSGTSMW